MLTCVNTFEWPISKNKKGIYDMTLINNCSIKNVQSCLSLLIVENLAYCHLLIDPFVNLSSHVCKYGITLQRTSSSQCQGLCDCGPEAAKGKSSYHYCGVF